MGVINPYIGLPLPPISPPVSPAVPPGASPANQVPTCNEVACVAGTLALFSGFPSAETRTWQVRSSPAQTQDAMSVVVNGQFTLGTAPSFPPGTPVAATAGSPFFDVLLSFGVIDGRANLVYSDFWRDSVPAYSYKWLRFYATGTQAFGAALARGIGTAQVTPFAAGDYTVLIGVEMRGAPGYSTPPPSSAGGVVVWNASYGPYNLTIPAS